jgi:DNA-binding transcriptional MerR regulator
MNPALSERAQLSIGKVLDELVGEFPGLTLSKLRFLDREGLVEPQRTGSGYRKYSYDDVEKLRFVLRMQTERYWPLSRIRQELDELESGREPVVEDSAGLRIPDIVLADDGLPVAATFSTSRGSTRLSREDLLDVARIDARLLDELELHGLISRRPSQKFYDADDLQIAALARMLAQLGVEPRHLRGMTAAADRESGLIDQAVPSAARASEEGKAAVADLASLMIRLHTILVRSRLRG